MSSLVRRIRCTPSPEVCDKCLKCAGLTVIISPFEHRSGLVGYGWSIRRCNIHWFNISSYKRGAIDKHEIESTCVAAWKSSERMFLQIRYTDIPSRRSKETSGTRTRSAFDAIYNDQDADQVTKSTVMSPNMNANLVVKATIWSCQCMIHSKRYLTK